MNEGKRKRIDIVSIKQCREGSIMYSPRKISSPSDAVELIRKFIDDSDREKFIVINLNTKNEPNSINVVSVGSLNASICHPREVFKSSILSNSATIIIAHNHPSGNPHPSTEDKKITERLMECGEILGIKVLDHVIVSADGYYSFKENN